MKVFITILIITMFYFSSHAAIIECESNQGTVSVGSTGEKIPLDYAEIHVSDREVEINYRSKEYDSSSNQRGRTFYEQNAKTLLDDDLTFYKPVKSSGQCLFCIANIVGYNIFRFSQGESPRALNLKEYYIESPKSSGLSEIKISKALENEDYRIHVNMQNCK